MLVIHVVRQFHPMVGGLEEMVANLSANLRKTQNIDSSILTLNSDFRFRNRILSARGEHRGVPITRIPWCGTSRYPFAPSARRHFDGADLVHVHGIDFFFDYLALTKMLHRMPMVASTHGGFFHTGYAASLKKVWFHTLTRLSARSYEKIIASSENDSEQFGKIAANKTITIENGVDVEKLFDSSSRELQPTLLFIGRFSVNKMIPDLIKLVAALGAPWRLLIAGMESDLSVSDLKVESLRCNVADRVEVFEGVEDAQLRELCGRASYIASASRFEGFGLSIIEGLSAGLTPIMNDIAPFQRLHHENGRGLCMPIHDKDRIVPELLALHGRILADYESQRQANISASERYSWSGAAATFAKVYRSVLGEPSAQASVPCGKGKREPEGFRA